jgi:branched-chain amino acid transport system permease protein/urea transport system permease protein
MDALALTQVLNLVYQLAVLVLVVLGLAIVFGLLGIMNMAHGDFLMLGAYSMVAVQQAGWPLLLGVPVAVVVTALAGWLVDWLLIRRLARRPFDTLLATWGLSILMRKAVEGVFGKGYQSIHQEVSGTVDVLGAAYPAYRLVLLAVVGAAFVALVLWWRRSPSGARVQAMVANPMLAEALGMDTRRMATGAFVIGVICAGVAGALLAPIVRIEPNMGLDYLLNSFFVLVVGGLGSLAGLGAGTGVIGGTQMLVSNALDQTWGYLAVLLVSIGFLWLRPDGLVARR